MPTVSAARITLIGLAASVGMRLDPSTEIVFADLMPMTLDEVEDRLTQLKKPLTCTAAAHGSQLMISCRPADQDARRLLAERAALMSRGEGVIGAVGKLPANVLLILRGAGLQAPVDREALMEWAQSYNIESSLGIGIERSTSDSGETHVISLSQVRSLSRSEFLKSIRKDSK